MDKNSKKYKIFKVVLVIVTTVFWTVGITEMSKEFLNEQLREHVKIQIVDNYLQFFVENRIRGGGVSRPRRDRNYTKL